MGRIDAWRARQEERARARRARLAELDGQLREVVETREIPRRAKAQLPTDGTLPTEVAALVDDGQVQRGVTLLVNLTGADRADAERAVAAHVAASGSVDGA